jgi:hypothetical protein
MGTPAMGTKKCSAIVDKCFVRMTELEKLEDGLKERFLR